MSESAGIDHRTPTKTMLSCFGKVCLAVLALLAARNRFFESKEM